MAGKRRATSDLNHDNWNEEEEPEDAGIFKRASQDELKKRVIKTAKRRLPAPTEADANKKNAFANFTGLSRTPAPPSNDSCFNQKYSSVLSEKITGKASEKSEVSCNEINTNEIPDCSTKEMSQEDTPTNKDVKNGEGCNEINTNEIPECSNKIMNQEITATTNKDTNVGSGFTNETDGNNITEKSGNQDDESKGSEVKVAETIENKIDAGDAVDKLEEVEQNKPINHDTMEFVSQEDRDKIDKNVDQGLNEIPEKEETKDS